MQHGPSGERLRLGLGTELRQMGAQSMEGLSHSPSLASVDLQKKRIEEISKKDSVEDFQEFRAVSVVYLFSFVRCRCEFLLS